MDTFTHTNSTTRQWPKRSTAMGLLALVALMVLSVVGPGRAGAAPSHRVVSDRGLGLSLTLPADWQPLTRAKDAPRGITLVNGTGRVITIEVLGTSRVATPSAIAKSFACGLTRGSQGVPIQRQQVRYAGAPGVMLLSMPGNRATVQIILVSHSVVYHVTLPGRTLAPAERKVLTGLHFIPVAKQSPVLSMAPRVKPCERF